MPGNFYDESGNCLGKHEGYPFYTIGQRRGLGIYLNKALFVKQIIPQTNSIILSDQLCSLGQTEMYLTDWHVTNPSALFETTDEIIVKSVIASIPTVVPLSLPRRTTAYQTTRAIDFHRSRTSRCFLSR